MMFILFIHVRFIFVVLHRLGVLFANYIYFPDRIHFFFTYNYVD